MIVFSTQTTRVDTVSFFSLDLFQYSSWIFLFIAFFSGFLRILHLQKNYSALVRKIDNIIFSNTKTKKERKKDSLTKFVNRITKPFTKHAITEEFGEWTYRGMVGGFILGIILYVVYKIYEYKIFLNR